MTNLTSDQDFLDAVAATIGSQLEAETSGTMLPHATEELFRPARALMAGGKRMRARLVRAGALAAAPEPSEELEGAIVALGAAVEVFQLATLIHDDVVDNSATRRGIDSMHVAAQKLHESSGWTGSARAFGTSVAIVAGDALFGSAFELAAQAAVEADAPAVVGRFGEMVKRVGWGQYLDLRAEASISLDVDPDLASRTAYEVISFKTVGYSAIDPLVLGVTLAGGPEGLEKALGAFARPFGIAFQLLDDDLGVFGDPALTGKPAGGDLAEGKQTVLLALTRATASTEDLTFIRSLRGAQITDAELLRARTIMTPARERMRAIIVQEEAEARAALTDIPGPAREILENLLARMSQA